MVPLPLPSPIPVSQASKIAERLLAHARLCRQIARASWDTETAAKLAQLADECTRAAARIEPACDPGGPSH